MNDALVIAMKLDTFARPHCPPDVIRQNDWIEFFVSHAQTLLRRKPCLAEPFLVVVNPKAKVS